MRWNGKQCFWTNAKIKVVTYRGIWFPSLVHFLLAMILWHRLFLGRLPSLNLLMLATSHVRLKKKISIVFFINEKKKWRKRQKIRTNLHVRWFFKFIINFVSNPKIRVHATTCWRLIEDKHKIISLPDIRVIYYIKWRRNEKKKKIDVVGSLKWFIKKQIIHDSQSGEFVSDFNSWKTVAALFVHMCARLCVRVCAPLYDY